jgi:hypothetical protein
MEGYGRRGDRGSEKGRKRSETMRQAIGSTLHRCHATLMIILKLQMKCCQQLINEAITSGQKLRLRLVIDHHVV